MNTNEQISKNPFGRLLNSQTAIDFYGRRMVGFVAAIVILVITVVSLFAQGLNLGLDFEGGNAWDVPASDTFDIDEAEQVLQDQGIDTAGARIQRRTSESADVVTVQIEEVSSEKSAEITVALADAAGVDTSAVSVAFTSSTWGAEITEKAVRALIVFFIVVSLFISLRFEWRMAVAAFAAMVHDVIAVVGVYSVFQFEVSPATVVAFLTILGYSLYDTIVVFDRVKENQAKFSSVRTPYPDIVNISMNQVLMRSLNTSIASILPVLSLLAIGWGLLGAEALEEFALALFIGMVVGVYSSIFIATPLLASMHRDRSGKVRRERLIGEALRAAVVGSSATGRDATHVFAKVGADEARDPNRSRPVGEPGSKTTPQTEPQCARPNRCSRTRLARARSGATDVPGRAGLLGTGILGTWQASTQHCEGSSGTSATIRSTASRSATSHRCSVTAPPSPRRSTAWSSSSTALRSIGWSASSRGASSSPLRSPTGSGRGSSPCARPASCRGRSCARSTNSNTARTNSRSTVTRSTRGSGS